MGDQEVGICFDFVNSIDIDVCTHIMSFIEDPADIVRAGAVSRSWRQFVVQLRFAKQLCVKSFPQISNVTHIQNNRDGTKDSVNNCMHWEVLVRQQEVYASLLHAITKSKVSKRDCIEGAVSASSTDNFPDESVVNTLNPRDRFIHRASYWSSKGQTDPEASESLIYKLRDGIWVITEIYVQPFEAFFQTGHPIYSSKSVRFRLGHLKSLHAQSDLQQLPLQKPADDMFIWTYESPEYPVAKENRLQPFVLPEPIPYVGGFLQVELLGRVQKQEMDELFYICVCHVRVLGRPLFPAFNIEFMELGEKMLLIYHPEKLGSVMENSLGVDIPDFHQEMLWQRIGLLEDLLRGIEGAGNQGEAEADENVNGEDELL